FISIGGRAPSPQSSQRSSRFHKPAVSRAALETATTPEWSNGLMDYWIIETHQRELKVPSIQHSIFFARVVQQQRHDCRERRQCRCESCREHHFGLQALK